MWHVELEEFLLAPLIPKFIHRTGTGFGKPITPKALLTAGLGVLVLLNPTNLLSAQMKLLKGKKKKRKSVTADLFEEYPWSSTHC
jgi:hypothetical protein